jgi:hypothetical protein
MASTFLARMSRSTPHDAVGIIMATSLCPKVRRPGP